MQPAKDSRKKQTDREAADSGNPVRNLSESENRKTDTSAVQAVAENKWKKGVRVSESRLETDGGPNRG